jgi:hypothetical protein
MAGRREGGLGTGGEEGQEARKEIGLAWGGWEWTGRRLVGHAEGGRYGSGLGRD